MNETQAETSPFWRFSLHFYREAGVSDACIALQDEYGVDVNLLLFLLWVAAEGRQLSAEEVRKLDDRVRDWRNLTVVPIRDARRKLKNARTLVEPPQQEAFRTKIKAVELEAERLQQQALYALAQSATLGTPAAAPDAAHANVCAYEHIMGAAFPRNTLDILRGAFISMANGEHATAAAGRE
jgi:uncharacterized protein (TIGR02444 family)